MSLTLSENRRQVFSHHGPFNILAKLCSSAGWLESFLIRETKDMFLMMMPISCNDCVYLFCFFSLSDSLIVLSVDTFANSLDPFQAHSNIAHDQN